MGSAPLWREKSRQAAPGSAKADISGPWSANPCWNRLARGESTRITTSGEGDFTAARVTSRHRGIRVSASSHNDAPPGLGRSKVCARGSHLIAVLASTVPGFVPSGIEVAAPRESEAMQAERSFERVFRASGEHGRAGDGNGVWPARRFESWKDAAFDEAAAEAALALSGSGVQSPARGRDRERQRQGKRPSPGLTKPREQGSAAREGL